MWTVKWSKSLNRSVRNPFYIAEEMFKGEHDPTLYMNNHSVMPRHWFRNSSYMPTLNISSYWKETHSWSNIVTIALFPHIKLCQNLPSSSFIDHVTPIPRTLHSFPSPMPPIKLLVVHPSETHLREHLTSLIAILALLVAEKHEYTSHAKFYLVTTMFESNEEKPREKSVTKSILMHELSTVQLCQKLVSMHLNIIPNYQAWSALSDLTELTNAVSPDLCQGNPQFNKILLNFPTKVSYLNDGIYSLKQALQDCPKKTTQFDFKVGSDEARLVFSGYANVWRTILGNFSYIGMKNQICDEGKLVKITNQKVDLEIYYEIKPTIFSTEETATPYLAIVSSVFNDLRLLTCGYSGFEQLPFAELLKAFDKTVWLLLAITMVIISIIFQKFATLGLIFSLTQSALVAVKMLLEQGNPFPKTITVNSRFKLPAAVLLLTEIILSNSYKCTNVNNLIIPRKQVPYQYLHELVNESFTIHTRSRNVIPQFLEAWSSKYTSSERTLKVTQLESHFHMYELSVEPEHLTSEVRRISEIAQILINMKRYGFEKEISTLLNLLSTASSLIPVTFTMLQNVAINLEVNNITVTYENVNDYSEEFSRLEENHLLQFLKRCNKAALVLPTHVGFDVIKKLEKEGRQNLYQGVEKYYEINIGFAMKGLVPWYFIQRVQYAHRCGLWMRWENFYKKKYEQRSKRRAESLKAPSMTGNISIIFAILFSGLLVSDAGFCFELLCGQLTLRSFSSKAEF